MLYQVSRPIDRSIDQSTNNLFTHVSSSELHAPSKYVSADKITDNLMKKYNISVFDNSNVYTIYCITTYSAILAIQPILPAKIKVKGYVKL